MWHRAVAWAAFELKSTSCSHVSRRRLCLQATTSLLSKQALPTPFLSANSIHFPNKTSILAIKMNFKLSTIFAIAQLILVAVAMQPNSTNFTNPTDVTKISPGCFQSGEPWKNLGTNESILAAYDDQWCKFAVGGWHLGVKVKSAAVSLLLAFQLIHS